MKIKYILGSASPRRRELFERLGLDFSVVTADVDEESCGIEGDPAATVENVALAKMKAVESIAGSGDHVLVTADTVVFADAIMGKPSDVEDAGRILKILSGRTHEVYTCVALTMAGRTEVFHEVSAVGFMELGEKDIDSYLRSGEFADKAGGYAIQGLGAFFIERIEGDYYNIVGFPVNRFIKVMRDRFGLDVLSRE